MAKKKNSKAAEKKASSFTEALGFNNIFHNERINFVAGILLLWIRVLLKRQKPAKY